MGAMGVTKMRLGRLVDERNRTQEKVEDALALAEEEKRPLSEAEEAQLTKYREQIADYDGEIAVLTVDLERVVDSKDVSSLLRDDPDRRQPEGTDGPTHYRTFASYARDVVIARYPNIATQAAHGGGVQELRERVEERLRAIEHTLTSDVEGLLPPTHLAQIMDIINGSRPVVSTARSVDLTSGKLTYPKISQRPTVIEQTAEKTEGGTAGMAVDMEEIAAATFIGGGNLSWQTINWSTPSALQLWFDLAAEAYARATETRACTELGTAVTGTVSPALGTTGTEDFAAWRAATFHALSAIYATTSGRARTNTLYLSAQRFFQLAGIGSAQILQVSPVGDLNVDAMTGTWSGLRVVGSYGLPGNTAIVGDNSAFLVGETPGAPVELRTVEPAIGGMECGIIGAFQAKVFDPQRFLHLS